MAMATAPTWFTVVSWVFIGLGLLCAAMILYDVFGRGYRQRIGAMEAVWPITAIYFGPLALLAYYRWGWGRPQSRKWQEEHGDPPKKSLPAEAATGATPCGAASFLAHLVAVPLVVLLGLTIAGRGIWPMIILIAVLALPLLLAFEYFSSTVPGRGLSTGKGLGVALLIAAVTVIAFDASMGAAMIFVHFVLMFPPTDVTFLFLMQIGLILGFLTTYPVVLWLVRRGTKEAV
jgi:hypothetical protein